MAVRHFCCAAVSILLDTESSEWLPPRQAAVMAIAKASAASAGFGIDLSFNMFMTMFVTCVLLARPLPVTAAFTSVGV
jgi:hypothetical protein